MLFELSSWNFDNYTTIMAFFLLFDEKCRLAISGVGLGCALAAPTPLGVGIGFISVSLSWNDLASEFTEEIEAGRNFTQGYCNSNICR